jgi:hypothetical protein
VAVGLEPVTGEGVEVEFENITAKDRQGRAGERLAQLMDEVVSQNLRAWAENKGRDEFGGGLERDP